MGVVVQNRNESRRDAVRPGQRNAPSSSGPTLDTAARRLLTALDRPGAYAFPDPSSPDELIVRDGGAGISLGRGRFPSEAGETLLRAGLAERDKPGSNRLVAAAAGQAKRRRTEAPAGTGFLAQHLDLVEGKAAQEPPLRDASESPLAWMAHRRGRDGLPLIDASSFEAGERLRRDLSLAGLMPRLTADWGAPRVDGSGPRDPAAASDALVAAKQRVDRALDAVGSDLSGLLIDLCGFLKGLERIEAERGWPARSAKVVIRIALGRLAEHYGLEREAVGPDRGRLRLWRARNETVSAS